MRTETALYWLLCGILFWPSVLMAQTPLLAYVMKVGAEWVYLDRGLDEGLLEGQVLTLFRETDGENQYLASLRIDQVFQQTSRARILSLEDGVEIQVLDFAEVLETSAGMRTNPSEITANEELLTPMIVHQRGLTAIAGEDANITVRASGIDGLAQVRLFYRMGDTGPWARQEMQSVVGDLYHATVSGSILHTGTLSYYVLVRDIDGRRGYLGNAEEPLNMAVYTRGGMAPAPARSRFRRAALIPGYVQIDNGHVVKGWVIRGVEAGLIAATIVDPGNWPLWAPLHVAVLVFNVVDAGRWSSSSRSAGFTTPGSWRPRLTAAPAVRLTQQWSW